MPEHRDGDCAPRRPAPLVGAHQQSDVRGAGDRDQQPVAAQILLCGREVGQWMRELGRITAQSVQEQRTLNRVQHPVADGADGRPTDDLDDCAR